jgi:hypothetical protein
MRLSRQHGKRFFPSVDVEDRADPPGIQTGQGQGVKSAPSSEFVYKGLFLGPSDSAIAPHTYICLAVKCSRGSLPIDMTVKKSGTIQHSALQYCTV